MDNNHDEDSCEVLLPAPLRPHLQPLLPAALPTASCVLKPADTEAAEEKNLLRDPGAPEEAFLPRHFTYASLCKH